MIVITAPDAGYSGYSTVDVFLAGGITGCSPWQDKVIEELESLSSYFSLQNVNIYNPRRKDFDVTDKDAEIEQIKWEHRHLKICDIFSCFFEANDSLQPITLYELGKWGELKKVRPVITIQKGYLRERDVLIQTALDGLDVNYASGDDAIMQHARSIAQRVKSMR